MENLIPNIAIQPQTEIQKKLFQIWLAKLGTNEFGTEDSFFDVGGNSLLSIPLVEEVEKTFNKKIDLYRFFVRPTIAGMEKLILDDHSTQAEESTETKSGKKEIRNFAPIKTKGNRQPFIMVHGDNCNNFMPKLLDKEQPYLGFLHIGSEGEKLDFPDIQTLAAYYIKQLQEYKPEGPYLLGGHSFGGIIAYEMANQLEQKGFKVPLLVVSDSIIPDRIPVFAFRKGFKHRFTSAAKRTYCKLHLALKEPVPVKFRKFYILDAYEKLACNYKPPIYDGKLLFIRASINEGENHYTPWFKAAKKLKLTELEGSHNEIINNKETIKQYVSIIQNELDIFNSV
ncbi:MAG: hypothetical protein JXR31_12585 [Prolixibacteraceae bacterium]|nr:hypothetical protein [Prolixibacteraceae bacterium]MBN2775084.1 hypothetical protein [Prolixibacteraceae bacterium]